LAVYCKVIKQLRQCLSNVNPTPPPLRLFGIKHLGGFSAQSRRSKGVTGKVASQKDLCLKIGPFGGIYVRLRDGRMGRCRAAGCQRSPSARGRTIGSAGLETPIPQPQCSVVVEAVKLRRYMYCNQPPVMSSYAGVQLRCEAGEETEYFEITAGDCAQPGIVLLT
jgi:hypothetical protein